jgi:two-component system, cell cycle response regulator DivK
VLRAAGFRTIEAGSGAQAVELAGERRPDVVLMDLGLPDMGGDEAVVALRDRAQTAGIPVVAMSSSPLARRREALTTAGFAGYIEKPIRVREFPDQVRRYCTGPPA